MEQSYNEILEVFKRLGVNPEGMAFRGSDRFLTDINDPCASPAALDLIDKAMNSEETLYVIALGAITNIASAIAMKPEIMDKIVVIWLGGHAPYWYNTNEFNLQEDVVSANYVLACGVPFIQISCNGVTSHLLATLADLRETLGGKNALCDLLIDRFEAYAVDHTGYAKALWDVGAVAYCLEPKWFTSKVIKTMQVKEDLTWQHDACEHPMVTTLYLNRTAIFRDLYKKLASAK